MGLTLNIKPLPLTATNKGNIPEQPASTVPFGMGSAGIQRALSYIVRMGEADEQGSLQCGAGYDFNQAVIRNVHTALAKFKARRGLEFILTGFVRAVDGFLRNPHAYRKYFSLIDRDIDRMLAEMMNKAERAGAPPQEIVTYMGFGGHATLSTIIFKKLRLQFPEANLFPVVLLPDDLTLEGWMRESTWREYEEALAGVLALVTDNAVGDPDDLDDRLSVGMASLHCAAHVEPTFGTIGENIAAFQPFSSGWVGLSVVRQRMPSKVVWSLIPPFRRRKLLRGVANELAWHVLTAIKEVTDPKHQLAEHQPPKAEAPGRIAVTLAVVGEDLEILKDDVMDQLRRDQFLKEHPHVVVAFASANFSAPKSTRLRMVQRSRGGLPGILKTCKTWVKDALGLLPRVIQNLIFGTSRQQLFVNVTHFYPIHGAIPRMWKILHGAGAPVVEAEPAYIGFGSFYHINPSPDLSRN